MLAEHYLGHSDPRLTLEVYAQATAEGDRRAADRLTARPPGHRDCGGFCDGCCGKAALESQIDHVTRPATPPRIVSV